MFFNSERYMERIPGRIFLLLLSCLLFANLSFSQSPPYFVMEESYVQGLLSPNNRPSFPRNILTLDRDVGLEAGQKIYLWLFFSIPVSNPDVCTEKDETLCVFSVTVTGKDKSGVDLVQKLTTIEDLSLRVTVESVWFMFSENLSPNFTGKASIIISFKRNRVSLYELKIPVNIHLYK